MVGCDPLVDFDGAYLPAWLIAGGVGLACSFLLSFILSRLGIAKYLWPRTLVHIAMFVMFTMICWLILYVD